MKINKKTIRKLTGRTVYVINNKNVRLTGKLIKVSGQKLYLQPTSIGDKKVKTSAILPLVLFDLLAVGTLPYTAGYGGYAGYGYPGYGYPGGVVGGYAPGYPGVGYPGVGYGGYTGFY